MFHAKMYQTHYLASTKERQAAEHPSEARQIEFQSINQHVVTTNWICINTYSPFNNDSVDSNCVSP